jgi:hypothetical protein
MSAMIPEPNQKRLNADPMAQTKEVFKTAIESYQKQLNERFDTLQADLHHQTILLHEVTSSDLSNAENITEKVETLKKSLHTRIHGIKELRPSLNVILDQIWADLQGDVDGNQKEKI